ncbi:MAG TPA: peptidyl-prolyl cis-trans isomerase [Bacteroidia bacterium]|nr:peptidyl-prolyl cis-trans isomerase [Bacteroidia bacterium]
MPRIYGAMILITLVTFSAFSSCNYLKKKEEAPNKEAIARVHDKYLYKEDIRKMLSPGTTKEDSALLANNFIQNWIKQQVILQKAETNLDEEKKDVEKKLEEYRNSLITYIYETELIRQRLDTFVTDQEIEKYYQENQRNFELKDNIIKVLYLKVKKDAPKIKKVKEWYKSSNSKDRLLLDEYCYQFASDFHLDDETWLLFDELLKKVPVKTYDKESFLRNNRFIEIEDSTDLYLVNIKDMKIRESLSPLSFVSDDIRVLIINKRKLSLIQEMEKATYDEAQKKNEFEIY